MDSLEVGATPRWFSPTATPATSRSTAPRPTRRSSGCSRPSPISRRGKTPASLESGNGMPDLLDEARWGLEWLLSVQEPGGGFHNTTCAGALRPVRLQPPRTHVALPRRRGGHHSHRLRRRNAGAMRQVGHPSVGRDVRMYAAAGLLLATGDCRLRVDFEESYQPLQNDPSYLRSNIYAALLYLRASAGDPERQRAIPSGAPPPRRGGSPGRRASPFPVGRSYVLGLHRSRLPADRRLPRPGLPRDPVEAAADCEQVLANVHHALGRNYQQIALPKRPTRRQPAGGPAPFITGWRPLTPDRSSFRAGGWRPHCGSGAG